MGMEREGGGDADSMQSCLSAQAIDSFRCGDVVLGPGWKAGAVTAFDAMANCCHSAEFPKEAAGGNGNEQTKKFIDFLALYCTAGIILTALLS